jgi:hypothetical protein
MIGGDDEHCAPSGMIFADALIRGTAPDSGSQSREQCSRLDPTEKIFQLAACNFLRVWKAILTSPSSFSENLSEWVVTSNRSETQS